MLAIAKIVAKSWHVLFFRCSSRTCPRRTVAEVNSILSSMDAHQSYCMLRMDVLSECVHISS